MRVLIVTAMLATLPATAHADESGSDDPGFNMLAVDLGVGAMPVEGAGVHVQSLGLGIEHPVFRVTRVFGEYDWLWLTRPSDRPAMDTLERHGTGHRASLGLRRELTAKGMGSFRLFLDGELGATFAITSDSVRGVTTLSGGFAGLRLGYDAYTERDESPSHTFEIGLLLRATALAGGVGVTGGLTMAWGN